MVAIRHRQNTRYCRVCDRDKPTAAFNADATVCRVCAALYRMNPPRTENEFISLSVDTAPRFCPNCQQHQPAETFSDGGKLCGECRVIARAIRAAEQYTAQIKAKFGGIVSRVKSEREIAFKLLTTNAPSLSTRERCLAVCVPELRPYPFYVWRSTRMSNPYTVLRPFAR